MIVLGIDPGTARLGYGLVERQGSALAMLDYGCLETINDRPLEQRTDGRQRSRTEAGVRRRQEDQMRVPHRRHRYSLTTGNRISVSGGASSPGSRRYTSCGDPAMW